MAMDANQAAGKILRKLRVERGLTLNQVATATRIPYENIGRWERSATRPPLEMVRELLAHYGVTWTQFGQYMDAQLGQGPERPEPTVDMSVADSFVARTRARIDADPDLRALYDRLTSGQTEHDERIARLESAVFRD